jgi:two-component system, chemotaxis family, chemotaxis protein CheY
MMRRTLLIVEDVETCAATLEILFSRIDNLNIVVATSGEQACRLLDHGAPGFDGDLAAIVTDLEMRGMDGFELIQRVRNQSNHRAVPIMVITGSSDSEAPAEARRLGANAFFLKPYSPVLVREKMEELLNHEISTS